MFEFKIKKNSGQARTGIFKTPHGEIKTPVFMPVGTKATVKTLSSEDLKTLNAEIILANTYHLYIRPGEKLIKKMGGLHKWMNFNGPILTDSGGFQIFSLGEGKGYAPQDKGFKTTVKIDKNGAEFSSHLDGSKHYFTPEKAIKIQHDLGADIIMAFDECSPAHSSKKYFKEAMERTHSWAERCKIEHQARSTDTQRSEVSLSNKTFCVSKTPYPKPPQALFGIVQGGIYKDLRIKSAKFINDLNFPGNAIGGLSVGESKEKMLKMIETVIPYLDKNKPRYLMGVGTPKDLFECIERGIDMFDCAHPTRMARHGAFWTEHGRFSIKNEKFKKDSSPLQKKCECLTCKNYSRSYLRHLIFENELLGLRLMTIHDLHFLLNLMAKIRASIEQDKFKIFKKDFFKKFKSKNEKI